MEHDKLVKLSAKELNDRLAEINVKAKTAEGDDLKALLAEAKDIQAIIADAQARAELGEIAGRAAVQDPKGGEEGGEVVDKVRSARGEQLKAGKHVTYKATARPDSIKATARLDSIKATLSTTQTALPTHTADTVNPLFNNVSSLVDRVRQVPLPGGETYQRGYVSSYGGDAAATNENANYHDMEPAFDYAEVKKEKLTAYTEEPEEMIKLPNADYDSVVESSVVKAIRRKMSKQILVGTGATGGFKGIFYDAKSGSNVSVIDPATDVAITAIDDGTLDEIIYSYGGDEEVEDIAVLILNKKDLKAFAKLRDKQGRKVYTVVNHGNTGTIDGVPFIINSACGDLASASAGDYLMAYGPMSNYELAIFSDIDARKSTDYKFKQGQIAYRADIFAGGAVVAKNGFLRVKMGS